jgi:hypothetical protein
MEPRYFLFETNGEYWFRPKNAHGVNHDERQIVRAPMFAWIKENIPDCYVSYSGASIQILHPTYATAFRMRWC